MNQITQMQPPTGPGSPAYVGTGSTQATPAAALAAPAATSPLLAALIGAQNTQGQQTQTGGGGIPLGLLAQIAGQSLAKQQTPVQTYTGANGNTPGGLPVGGGDAQYGGLS